MGQPGSNNLRLSNYFYDGNGNVGQIVNADDGTLTARYEYDAFGNSIVLSGTEADDNAVRFSTKYWDADTGLYYYGFRYHHVQLGMWISRDPVGEKGGINLYLFCMNNPIILIDILGREVATGIEQSYNKDLKEKFFSAITTMAELTTHIAIQLTIETIGSAVFVVELTESFFELAISGAYFNNKPVDSVDSMQILDIAGDISIIVFSECGECTFMAIETAFAFHEGFTEHPNPIASEYFGKKRSKFSDWSNQYKDKLNDVISGGKKSGTILKFCRHKISDFGTLNKSVVIEMLREDASDLHEFIESLVKSVDVEPWFR